jgi:pimeloyl-ACP methyl ester carboxylesterase
MSSHTLTLPDGRQLGYAIEGEGKPIIYFHGTSSSRLETKLLSQFAKVNSFRIIGVDRPGYGLSTYLERTNLRGFAKDIQTIADHLKLGNFAVLSWSGGGPFALAYLALHPDRVNHALIVGCPALPFDPAVAHNNNPLAKIAMKNRYLAKSALGFFRRSVLKANRDVDGYLRSRSGKRMLAGLSEPDYRFFADPEWLKLMYNSMAEGFRQVSSPQTVYEEHRLFMKPWNEPIWQIPEGKLTIWQGAEDKTCPRDCAQKIAKIIKGVSLEVFPSEGHCVMFTQKEKLAKELNR